MSDCIPGVKGIGEKTAQKLLARYGTLDDILADCENIPEKAVREKICSGIEQAKMSQYLATIVRDLDVNFDFDSAKINLPDVSVVTEFLKKMQFYTFIKNIIERTAPVKPDANSSDSMQLGFFAEAVNEEINKEFKCEFDKKLITDSRDFSDMLKELKSQSLIAFNIYADVKNAVDSKVIGFAFAYNKDIAADKHITFNDSGFITKTFYIPISHSNIANQLRLEDVINDLKSIFENETIHKTTYNAKNAYNILRNLGILSKSIIFDVALASYVKDPQRNHELDVQSMEHLNHAITPFVPFEKNKKKQISFSDAPVDSILNYSSDESFTILELTKYWINNLDNKELELTYDIEVPLTFVLADMEYTGVSVDENYLHKLTISMNNKLSKIEGRIFELAGEVFNINSPRQVGEVLFEKLGLKAKKKRGKTNYSTNAAVLEELAEEYEIAQLILDYRKFAKLKSTYTEALPALIDRKDNRIHTTYNQTVTATGRLSSSNPNLQNIPARSDFSKLIRNSF